MKQHSQFLSLLFTLMLLTSCAKKPRRLNRLRWPVMGTIAAVQSVNLDTAQKLRGIAIAEFQTVEDELSAWNESSTLSIINTRAGSGTPTSVSETFSEILKISTSVSRQSNAAFNPLLGPVLHAWGFGGVKTPLAPPSADALTKALCLTKITAIKANSIAGNRTVELTRSGMKLDLGAVAKGYAVDRVWEKAKEKNLTNFLIDLGGNLRAMGEARPGRGGWLTGIKDPFNKNNLIAKILILDGEAIATSGNYERFVKINGELCAHIIDGRTAKPVKGIAAVTVISPNAATADLLSTTLFVLGVAEGKKFIAKHYPDSLALWIPNREPSEIIATEKMARRLRQ